MLNKSMEMDVLYLLQEAIMKNVVQPIESEKTKYQFIKMLPSSPSYEGHNEMGAILFIGVADSLGINRTETEMFLSIDSEEYDFKLGDYGERMIGTRFYNKVRLINNYLKHKN
jgi:hypothetical protein